MIRIIKTLIFLVTLVISIATCVAYYSSYIQPDILNHLVLIQFAFPYLWLANAVLVVVDFLFGKNWKVLLPLLTAIVTANGALSVFNIAGGRASLSEAKTLKILTYNVHYLSLTKSDSVVAFLKEQDADIVCMQEADNNSWKRMKSALSDYKYVLCHRSTEKNPQYQGDRVIVASKYPMNEVPQNGDKELGLFSQWLDVCVGNDTIRLVNCHLASIGLKSEQIGLFDVEQKNNDLSKGEIKKQVNITVSKMSSAYHIRQRQIESIELEIKKTGKPVVICGDFNDTPISYTYQVMKRVGLKDSFYEVGRGLGDTYNGKLPPIRIDYVWYSPDRIKALNYKEIKVPYSDHFPVLVNLELLP